jgi:alcohol dehydrogenase
VSKRFFLPTQLIYGAGSRKEVKRFIKPGEKVLVITDKGLVKAGVVEKVTKELDAIGAKSVIYDDVRANPHVDTVQAAVELAKQEGASSVVTVGGGSPMDVAKAVALLMTNEGTFLAKSLIIASGAVPRALKVPGEDETLFYGNTIL